LKNTSRSNASPNRRQGLSPPTEANQLLPLGRWPSEGRTLGAILQPLFSPADWSELLKHTRELLTQDAAERRWAVIRVHPPFSPPELIKEFLKLWHSGQLIAKGRRGDLLAAPVEIPPASVGYDIEVADFTRSVIRDPTYPEKLIYDLRFFKSKPETEPRAKNGTQQQNGFQTSRLRKALDKIYPEGLPSREILPNNAIVKRLKLFFLEEKRGPLPARRTIIRFLDTVRPEKPDR
jgi:hypothetical protein